MNFLCTECGHNAASKLALKKHARKHDKREFSCDECEKIIIGYSNFNGHKAMHRKVTCPICWKLIHKNSLTSHKALCSEDKIRSPKISPGTSPINSISPSIS